MPTVQKVCQSSAAEVQAPQAPWCYLHSSKHEKQEQSQNSRHGSTFEGEVPIGAWDDYVRMIRSQGIRHRSMTISQGVSVMNLH